MKEFFEILLHIGGIFFAIAIGTFMFMGVWEVIAEKITATKHRCKQRLEAADKKIADLSSQIRELDRSSEKFVGKLKEKDEELNRKETELKKREKELKNTKAELEETKNKLMAVEKLYNQLYKTKTVPLPATSEASLETILNDFDKADEKENNLSNFPLILRFQVDDYVKSVENDSIKRIEQSDFGIEESFFKNLSASTIMDDNDKEKSDLPTLIHIDETNSFLFSFSLYSKQKNGTWKKYQTSLSSCSCESWTFNKTNPKTGNKIPCKHMTFLAQHLGIFDINNKVTKQ